MTKEIPTNLEWTEADSNAVPLVEKPLRKGTIRFGRSQAHNYGLPKTGIELARVVTDLQAEGEDVLPVVNSCERQWREEGEEFDGQGIA